MGWIGTKSSDANGLRARVVSNQLKILKATIGIEDKKNGMEKDGENIKIKGECSNSRFICTRCIFVFDHEKSEETTGGL